MLVNVMFRTFDRHYLQGDALEEKVHSAMRIVCNEIRSQKEPTDPECYISFIVGYILMGVCFDIK